MFTHLSRDQAVFYLAEVRRALAAGGAAFTTWFFFDSASTPFLPDGPHALYADEKDFSAAVLFDRGWFLGAVRQLGLTVTRTRPPGLPGHQWEVWLAPRGSGDVDQFPLGEEGSELLCRRDPAAAGGGAGARGDGRVGAHRQPRRRGAAARGRGGGRAGPIRGAGGVGRGAGRGGEVAAAGAGLARGGGGWRGGRGLCGRLDRGPEVGIR